MTAQPRHYSHIFHCLHDEPEPVGAFGRGVHYSVLRTLQWRDVLRESCEPASIQDLVVIWDEDHDTRIIEVLQRLLVAGLLSPVLFAGERKGNLHLIVDPAFAIYVGPTGIKQYEELVEAHTSDIGGDYWPVRIGSHRRDKQRTILGSVGIVDESDDRIETYLRAIDLLWRPGLKPFHPMISPEPDDGEV